MSAHQDCPRCSARKAFRRLEYTMWALIAANVVVFSVLDVATVLNHGCTQAKHDAGGEEGAGKHTLSLKERLRGDDEGAKQAATLERVVPVFVGSHARTLTFAGGESIA